ncbi:MAG: T9SS type A sorting domain-containing protein [Bacteroidota bacterium]
MKNKIIIVIYFLFSKQSIAQQFLREYGDTVITSEWAAGMAITPDTDFVFWGSYRNWSLSWTAIANLKIDKYGNEIYSKSDSLSQRSPGTSPTHAFIISTTNQFYGGGKVSEQPASYQFNAFLAKLDANGDTVFTKEYVLSNFQSIVKDLKQTSDGNILLAGEFHDHFVNGDMFLMKVDTNDNVLWQKNYTDSSGFQEEAFRVIEMPDHDLIITGMYRYDLYSNNDTSLAFLMRTDSAGNMKWLKYYAQNYGTIALDVSLCPDSGFIICGSSFLSPNHNNLNGYISKIDSGGNMQWEKYYQLYPSQYAELYNAIPGINGGYYISGTGLDSISQERGWFLRLDDNGNILWQEHYTEGNYLAYITDMKMLGANDFIMCGTINHPGGVGKEDYLVIRTDSLGCYVNCFTGTGVFNLDEQDEEEIVVYPNPFSDQLTIKYPLPENTSNIQVQFINPASGAIEKSISLNSNEHEYIVNCSDMPSGVHIVKMFTDQRQVGIQKVVLIK